jgi:hypothetical protein
MQVHKYHETPEYSYTLFIYTSNNARALQRGEIIAHFTVICLGCIVTLGSPQLPHLAIVPIAPTPR